MRSWLARTITSCFIGLLYIDVYVYAPPLLFGCIFIALGIYVLVAELIPLYPFLSRKTIISATAYVYVPLSILTRWAFHTQSKQLVAYSFILASVIDVSAYIIGSLCGKHKLAPQISPKKTWEGFAGGWIAASITWAVLYRFTMIALPSPSILPSIVWWMFLGLCTAFAGLLGDLYVSMLKRKAGIKDTGTILPGHGGLLDRLDSILAITLFVWLLHRVHI